MYAVHLCLVAEEGEPRRPQSPIYELGCALKVYQGVFVVRFLSSSFFNHLWLFYVSLLFPSSFSIISGFFCCSLEVFFTILNVCRKKPLKFVFAMFVPLKTVFSVPLKRFRIL